MAVRGMRSELQRELGVHARTRTVSEVALQIGSLLGSDPLLRSLRISGEVVDLSGRSARATFFSLRDERAVLECVMFQNGSGGKYLEDGAQVICSGKAQLYAANGKLQIVANRIEPAGEGELQRRLNELRNRLQAEGLFEDSRKRALPRFPNRIAVITSEHGSAIEDILAKLNGRYPVAEVFLFPVTVQGRNAVPSIVRAFSALEAVASQARIDVAILARGGGSDTDLSPFNDETVIRAVFACRVPIVTGVAHHDDTPIVEMVADRRASTPTDAAAVVTERIESLRPSIQSGGRRMTLLLSRNLTDAKERRLQTVGRMDLAMETKSNRIREALDDYIHRIRSRCPDPSKFRDDVVRARTQLVESTGRFTRLRKERLDGTTAQLRILSPENTRNRGFAIVRDSKGNVVTRAKQAHSGIRYILEMADGSITADAVRVDVDQ